MKTELATMTRLSSQQQLGNRGEVYVAWALARAGCIVRTASGVDVGIDLYCETTEGGVPTTAVPHLHFFVQVKAGAQCERRANGDVACDFDVDHLQYWFRQPVPVFVALVPNPIDLAVDPEVFLVDVTAALLDPAPPDTGRTLRSYRRLEPSSAHTFLFEDVPRAMAQKALHHGTVLPLPTLHNHYVQQFPRLDGITTFGRKIRGQLRLTVSMALIRAWHADEPFPTADHELLAAINEVFAERETEDRHWETHFALGLALHRLESYDRAAAAYRAARDILVADPTPLDFTKPPFEGCLEDLQRCESAAMMRAGLPPWQRR